MKKEITVLKEGNVFITSYNDYLVPSIGDTLLVSDDRYYQVIRRFISPNSDRVVVMVSEVKLVN